MAQRIALSISAALSAFVLVVVGAVFALSGRTAAPASPTLDPALVAELQAREAAYQTLIAQANAERRSVTPTEAPTATPSPEPTAVVYPVSPELAVYIALRAAPGAYVIKPPELVLYRGAVAYEVTLNTGRVYVDANSGAVLWNGAASSAGGGSSGSAPATRDDHESDDD